MLQGKEIQNGSDIRSVNIECPICRKKKKLNIPQKIINQSKQLTTVSVPSGLVCEHNFQSFIDKNFQIRGYQKVDFELSRMEFYQDKFDTEESEEPRSLEKSALPKSSISQNVIEILRNCVDSKEILGSALFTLEGQVLYSSLLLSTLFNTIREFEVRNEKNLIQVKKYFLVLANNQKIFSQYIELDNLSLIITLIFSDSIRLGMGDLLLRNLIKKIQKLNGNLKK